jgi:hypothetical protein
MREKDRYGHEKQGTQTEVVTLSPELLQLAAERLECTDG